MTSSFKGKKILPALVLILFTLVLISGAFSLNAFALTANEPIGTTNTVKVAHISDIHYFPMDLCPNEYAGTHFEIENKQDFKLVAESGTMLNAVCNDIYNQATTEGLDVLIVSGDLTKDGEKRAHIDLANRLRKLQNDIRNAQGNNNFQILVLPGNHDLYNTDGNRYNVVVDAITGEKKNFYVDKYGNIESEKTADGKTEYFVTDAFGNKIPEGTSFKTEVYENPVKLDCSSISATSIDEFMKIYSGLGYPEFDKKEVEKYSDLAQSPEVAYTVSGDKELYFNTPFCHFENSTNSPIFDFKYFNDKFDATHQDKNILDYAADYVIDYIGLNVQYDEKHDNTEIKKYAKKLATINANSEATALFNNMKELGRTSYIATPKQDSKLAGYNFAMVDSILREVNADGYMGYEHKTGGKILDHTMLWLKNSLKESRDRNDTIISSFHHGSVPHFAAQEIFMNDFVLYDWEQQVLDLTDCGIGYTLTGHVHATDIVSYVADNGKPIVDIVTGSIISFGSPVRYLTFERSVDTTVKDTVSDKVHTINSFKGVPSTLVFENGKDGSYYTLDNPAIPYNKDTKANFGSKKYIDNVQQYIFDTTMDTVIPNVAEGYVNAELFDNLLNSLPDTNMKSFLNGLLGQLVNDFKPTFLDEKEPVDIFTYIYKTLNKTIEECKNDTEKPFDLNDMMRYSYTQYIVNGEATTIEYSPIKVANELVTNGELAKRLLGTANNKRGLLYPVAFADNSLLSQLIDFKFTLNTAQVTKLNKVFKTFLDIDLQLNEGKFSLNDIINNVSAFIKPLNNVPGLLGDIVTALNDGYSVPTILKTFASNYLNDKFYTNTSKIVVDILASFGVQENKFGYPLVKLEKDASGKYITKLGTDIGVNNSKLDNGTSVANNGTLVENGVIKTVIQEKTNTDRGFTPSMFTLTYGDKPQTDMNLMWNTADFMDSTITISGVDSKDIKVEKVVLPYGYPYFDLGFFSNTSTDSFKSQRSDIIANGWSKSTKLRKIYTVKVTGLKANTTYNYTITTNVSSDAKASLKTISSSTVNGKFTTAKDGETVKFVSVANMNGSTIDNYTKVNTNLNSATVGADFVLNVGGMVDNSKNIKQWSYLLNNVEAFKNLPTVLATGSKDKAYANYFELANKATGKPAESGAYYAYNIANVKIIVLNTNSLNTLDGDKAQFDWLKKELQNKGNAKWTVVAMNHGMYTNGPHANDTSTTVLRERLTTLFYDEGVDIVLQGVDKALTASCNIDRNGNNTTSNGVLYLSVGSIANDNYYTTHTENYIEKTITADNEPTYCVFNVNGANLSVELKKGNTVSETINLAKNGVGTDNTISTLKIADINSNYSKEVALNSEERYTVSNGFSVKNLIYTKPENSTWRNWKIYSKQKPNGREEFVEIAPDAVLGNGNIDLKIAVTSQSGAVQEYTLNLYVENKAETIFGELLYVGGEKREQDFCFKNLKMDDVIMLDLVSSPDIELLSEGFVTYTDIITGETKDTNTYRYVFNYKGKEYTLDHDGHKLYQGTTWMKYKIYDNETGELLAQINYSAETPKDNTKKIVLITIISIIVVVAIINAILVKTKGKGLFSFLDKFKKNKQKYNVN